MSDDGLKISATIAGSDGTYITQGLWTGDRGWVETMPPAPADGGLIDNSYGSAWGLSGDGSKIVGHVGGTGFLWTLENGLENMNTWLAANGVEVSPDHWVSNVTGISDDGRFIAGILSEVFYPWSYHSFYVTIDASSDVPDNDNIGSEIGANFPNPFNPTTTIPVTLAADAEIKLEIYDVGGRHVRTLFTGALSACRHEFAWDGKNDNGLGLASGVYFSSLQGRDGTVTGRHATAVKAESRRTTARRRVRWH